VPFNSEQTPPPDTPTYDSPLGKAITTCT
jgi:hypothetical protein